MPGAVVLTGASGSITGTTDEATREAYEPSHHWPVDGVASVWYRWSPPADGRYVFDTVGASFDSVLAAYAAGGQGGLTRITADDDAWYGQRGSRIRFDAFAGTTYYLAVAVKETSGDPPPTGSFTLRWREHRPPANDRWIWAEPLTGSGGTVAATNADATPGPREEREPNGTFNGGHSVWYRYVAVAAGSVSVEVAAGYRLLVHGYEGTTPGTDARMIASDVDPAATGRVRIGFNVEPRRTYRISVDGFGGATGSFTLTWTFSPARLTQPNDDFANARVLAATGGTLTGTSFGATSEDCEPAKAFQGWRSVWFRLDAPFTGTLTVETAGSRFDTVVTVMDRRESCYWSSGGTGDDDGGGDELTSRVVLEALDGGTYWIALGGHGWDTGAYTLRWQLTPAPPPANDAFASARVLEGRAGEAYASNAGASKEAGEPAHAGEPGGRSLWFRWTAPASGRGMFRVQSSSFPRVEPVIAIYTGSTVSTLTQVAANRGWAERTARTVFDVVAGVTYHVAVDSVDGNEGSRSSTFLLRWNSGPPPPNDLLANAQTLTGDRGSAEGTNVGAADEPGEPAHHPGFPAAASVWYRWTAPASGPAGFYVDAADEYNSFIAAVYTGASHLTLVRFGSAPGDGWGNTSVSFDAVRGTTYLLAVDGKNEHAGAFRLTWTGTSENDDFVDAIALTGSAGSFDDLLSGSDREPGEPDHAGRFTEESVWYRWTAPASGTVRFETCRSGFHTTLAVYTGSRVDALTPVAASLDNWCGERSRVWFHAVAGRIYHVAVAPFYGGSLGIGLDWAYGETAQTLTNDAWSSPYGISLWDDPTSLHLTNVGATKEGSEPAHAGNAGGHSVWIEFVSHGPGEVTLDTNGSGFDTLLAVYEKRQYDTVGSMPLIASSDDTAGGTASRVTFRTPAREAWYRVAVDGKNGQVGTFRLGVSWIAWPGNDGFQYGLNYLGPVRSELATREAGEPVHGAASGKSVWFRWTALRSGPQTFDTDGSTFDTSLAIYRGTSLTTLTRVGQSDDHDGLSTSKATFEAVAGTEYRIAVDGVAGGHVRLNPWNGAAATGPANDHFEQAAALTGASGETVTSPGGTRQPLEPGHHGDSSGGSVWYRWTAPATGSVTLSAVPHAGDPRLAVYTGTSVGSLTRVASDDDGWGTTGSLLRFQAVAGTVYSIAYAGGSGPLRWRTRAPGTAPPFVDLVAPTDATRIDRWENVYIDAEDESGIARVEFLAGGKLVRSDATRPYQFLWDVQSLADGPTEVLVRAFDATGVASEVRRTVLIDNRGPVTTITEGPTGEVRSSSATFAFSADEPVSGFRCRLDGGYYAACSSPVTYTGLASGEHRFSVYATSPEGKVGYTATRDWVNALPGPNAPPNDDFAAAQALVGESGRATGSNVDASKQDAEPDHGGEHGGRSIWYRWTAPRTGEVALDTFGTGFNDPLLAVYTGSTVAGLLAIAQNDDWDVGTHGYQARLTFGALAGTTYLVALDGSLRAAGPTVLNWTYLPQPPAVDTLPPQTGITEAPSGTVDRVPVTIVFTSYEFGSTFECRLDEGAWQPCSSPARLWAITAGQHTWAVRATDVAGNVDATPAVATWTMSSTFAGPETTITDGPAGTTATPATFAFSADGAAGFECRLDGEAWEPCSSPESPAHLVPGAHTFEVRAVDSAGGVDATPARRDFRVVRPFVALGTTVWRPSNGVWYRLGGPWEQWGRDGDVPVPGDYDGNGSVDLAVWRPSDGVWYVRGQAWSQWGAAEDVPVPADYDGDGDVDIAVWRPSTGVWYVLGRGTWQWGQRGDVPVPADYDGDGRDDIAVWRPSTGVWWVQGQGSWQWGAPEDVPVPADYDGNRTDDIATWRPSDGVWYRRGSSTRPQWGGAGDVPVPADRNGDGAAELVVWRPSDGVWYVANGVWAQWGMAGDIP